MKRIIGILLTVCMLFSFAACGKEKKEQKTSVIDLKYYSKLGQIPESEYALGQEIDPMIAAFDEKMKASEELGAQGQEHEDLFYYSATEFVDYTSINTGSFEYCYKNDKKDGGVSCIISYGDSYKFKIGTLNIQIKQALTEFDVQEYDTDSNNLFFFPGAESLSCLKYTFEKNDIVFVFVDNALTATVIYNNDEWSF